MKKQCFPHYLQKLKKDNKIQYVKKYRFYPNFMYSFLDNWLKTMSLSGFHIVHSGLFTYWFEIGKPMEKEYFTYGDPINEGKYSIALRYPLLEKTYGVNKKQSKINNNISKSHNIIEIDLQKIDVKKDIGYNELIKDRNRLYLLFFLRNIFLIIVTISIVFVLRVFKG